MKLRENIKLNNSDYVKLSKAERQGALKILDHLMQNCYNIEMGNFLKIHHDRIKSLK